LERNNKYVEFDSNERNLLVLNDALDNLNDENAQLTTQVADLESEVTRLNKIIINDRQDLMDFEKSSLPEHRNSPSFDDPKQNNKDSFIFGLVESKDSYIDISKEISSQTPQHKNNNTRVPRIPDIPKTPKKDLLIKSAREPEPTRPHSDLNQTKEDYYQLQIINLNRTVENLNITVGQKETYIGILERKLRQHLSDHKDLGLLG
jgi:hypothetical protein